jgi:hypothetical protein
VIVGFVGSGVVYAVSLEGVSDALYLSVSDPLCSTSRPLDALKLLTFFLSPTLGLRSPAAIGAVLAVCAGEVCVVVVARCARVAFAPSSHTGPGAKSGCDDLWPLI